jgi:large subunit ribosomal protein L35
MPKVKTHKGTAKRIKVTATGKAISWSNMRNHLNEAKSSKRMRKLRKANVVHDSDMGRIKALLPYEF